MHVMPCGAQCQEGPDMAVATRFMMLCIAGVGAAGCAASDTNKEPGFQSINWQGYRFEPSVVTARAGQPVTLEFAVTVTGDLTVFSPALGMPKTRIPGRTTGRHGGRMNIDEHVIKKTKLTVGPMAAGKYEFFCDCHGQLAVGQLLVQ
jgi:plastocyanin